MTKYQQTIASLVLLKNRKNKEILSRYPGSTLQKIEKYKIKIEHLSRYPVCVTTLDT